MGGAISLVIGLFAVAAFVASGQLTLAMVAGAVSMICLWSWLHMMYFARLIARNRLFVAALDRGDFEQGSPEAERYWHQMRIEVDPCDSVAIPNWISGVNMGGTVAALVLLGWGSIAYWSSPGRAPSALMNIAIVVSVGLGLFFVIGNLIDAIVFRLGVGPGDPLLNILASGKYNPRRRLILNAVRPVILTVIIFGGGLLTIFVLGLNTWGAIVAGAWFFFLTQIACLAGRGASLNEAGWAMVFTMMLLAGAFIALRIAR